MSMHGPRFDCDARYAATRERVEIRTRALDKTRRWTHVEYGPVLGRPRVPVPCPARDATDAVAANA